MICELVVFPDFQFLPSVPLHLSSMNLVNDFSLLVNFDLLVRLCDVNTEAMVPCLLLPVLLS